MISKTEKEAFVWIWLPDETEPVVAGRLEGDNGNVLFNYGRGYAHIWRQQSEPTQNVP
jgi:serine/threonine-protein kinase HipA